MPLPRWADVPARDLLPVEEVAAAAIDAAKISSSSVMLVGAACRDLIHSALGHHFPNTATADLDLAVAVGSWESYDRIAAAFPREGNSRVRFHIAGRTVDVVPFDGVENPAGTVKPPARQAPLSVWSFREVFADSEPLALPSGLQIQIPSVAGYAALKLGAWLDRSAYGEVKDAPDLALVLYWYAEAADVEDELYGTDEGVAVLVAEELDVPRSAAHLLGRDVVQAIGPVRCTELLRRWPGNIDLLHRSLTVFGVPGWSGNLVRRRELVAAFTRGLRH